MNIIEQLSTLTHEAQQGLSDPLYVYTLLYNIEKVAGEYKRELFEQVESKVSAYGKEQPEVNGYRLSISSRKNWKYSDPEIERLESLAKSRKQLCQKAYAMQSKGGVFTDENGEIIPPAEFTETTFIKAEKI
jgi:hypothetical protein